MLITLLAQLGGRRCCFVYELRRKANSAKLDKVPVNAQGFDIDHTQPSNWLTGEEALAQALCMPPGPTGHPRGVGISLSESLRIGCIDIDGCAILDANGHVVGWSQFAIDMCARFPGAAVEVSQSGKALHILFTYTNVPEHRTRKKDLAGLEVYTRNRFIALTGTGFSGDLNTDHTAAVQAVIAQYLPEPVGLKTAEWTDEPYNGWRGNGTDEQIVFAMINRRTAASAFGGGASFADLWHANADSLAHHFPDSTGNNQWDRSAADQALANHLAFATGYDCERTLRIMWQADLRRDKWERDDYLPRTIMRAVAGRREEAEAKAAQGLRAAPAVPPPPPPPPGDYPAPPPPPPAPAEIIYTDPATGSTVDAHGVLNIKPVDMDPPAGKFCSVADMQVMFTDHVYVRDVHAVVLPDGSIVDQKQFNAMHGGRTFQMTIDGKDTKDAWEAFINNQVQRFARAEAMLFDPKLPPSCIIERDGLAHFNSWAPIEIPMTPGDPAPFINHIRKLYPYGQDAELLTALFAALMQHKGTKFAWWPLLQGVEGNGKTFFSLALEHCMGSRYTHHARAAQLDSTFNSAFYGKLLICVEDVFISEQRSSVWETLKPMITNLRMEIEGKGVNKVTRDVCFNGVMNSNHKAALRKTPNDRRIAPFFGAQQTAGDLVRAGMNAEYFKTLYGWANSGGWAIIAHYLAHYKIPDAMNPAVDCVRAPRTSSTEAAITASRGSIEQEVLEAIDSGREGFRDGWINSVAFDSVLQEMGRTRALPRNQRKELIEALGYEPHPKLPNGRVILTLPDGTRPVLYLKPEHPAYSLDGGPATSMYLASQAPKK